MTDIAILTPAEETTLADCEQAIERGMLTFVEVGAALGFIRDSRLYRATHETFEAYCADRWGFTGRRGRQLIEAAEIGTIVPVENEGQARELAKVPETDREDVWRETVEQTNGKPTAAAVAEVAEQRRKQAAEQRDARALLLRAVDLLAPVNRSIGFVDAWIRQLGPYDEELSELVKRAGDAITVLDNLIEGAGDQ